MLPPRLDERQGFLVAGKHRNSIPPYTRLEVASESSNQNREATLPTQNRPAHKHRKQGDDSYLKKEFGRHKTLRIVAAIAIVAICVMLLVGLFAPGLRYSSVDPIAGPIDSQTFLNELEPLVNSKITRNNRIEAIENGDHFYQAELEAMRQARHSINIEAYIFHKGKLTDDVLGVLTEGARAGVHERCTPQC